jgi:hypothetical protein
VSNRTEWNLGSGAGRHGLSRSPPLAGECSQRFGGEAALANSCGSRDDNSVHRGCFHRADDQLQFFQPADERPRHWTPQAVVVHETTGGFPHRHV